MGDYTLGVRAQLLVPEHTDEIYYPLDEHGITLTIELLEPKREPSEEMCP